MPRQINTLYLTNAQKRTLRQAFNAKFGKNYQSISQIRQALGVDNTDYAYEKLRASYNEDIVAEQKKARNARDRMRRLEKKQAELAIPISSLSEVVYAWLRKNPSVIRFQITLRGINNSERTFKFNNSGHFDNWLIAVLKKEESTGSDNVTVVSSNLGVFDIVRVVDISPVAGGCNHHDTVVQTLKTNHYTFSLTNPSSLKNDCFFACYKIMTGIDFKNSVIRKQFGIPINTPISPDDATKIMTHFTKEDPSGQIFQIIDETVDDVLDENKRYMLLANEKHYKIVDSFKLVHRKEDKTKRGYLFFDFETRPTNERFRTKIADAQNRDEYYHVLADTICCVVYTPWQSGTDKKGIEQRKCFVSNSDKSSSRQFIDFMLDESRHNRNYNCYAHNGSRFDFYFILKELTRVELLDHDVNMRGTSVIRMKLRAHVFKDTCCFLTDSLSNLSNSFKVEHGKITSMSLHGKQISSSELCFYRPELKYKQFLELQHSDSEFWKLYVDYCMYDCLALKEIWGKYSESVDSILESIFPRLRGIAPLGAAMTIGSHAKNIIQSINTIAGKSQLPLRKIEEFAGLEWQQIDGHFKQVMDFKKYEFLCCFKRGGISHCNKPGLHTHGVTGVDIASQYPAAMMNSMLPCGKSEWTTEYDPEAHGFYLLRNVKFERGGFKPASLGIKGESLQWDRDILKSLYVDSYLLKYLVSNYGMTFDVEEGLVSNEDMPSSKLFGKFIDSFYSQKKLQDLYKQTNDPRYNEAFRTTCKLYLNSLSGKMVENPSKHYSLKFVDSDSTKDVLNGVGIEKHFNDEKYNAWIVAGIMIYSYSKRLLFEYIHCLPEKNNSVIHVETDGIYFDTRDLEEFETNLENYSGDMDCVKFGEDLGNLKIEKTSHEGTESYFLGKKFYCLGLDTGKNIMRVKGAPLESIDDHGKKVSVVDLDTYKDVYAGKSITKSWAALKKDLFAEKVSISAHSMTRTLNPCYDYTHYF